MRWFNRKQRAKEHPFSRLIWLETKDIESETQSIQRRYCADIDICRAMNRIEHNIERIQEWSHGNPLLVKKD